MVKRKISAVCQKKIKRNRIDNNDDDNENVDTDVEDAFVNKFIHKLFTVFTNVNNAEHCSYDECGKIAFCYNDVFKQNILPQLVKSDNIDTLIRQLNYYGFQKTVNLISDKNYYEYINPFFNMNNLHLIRRRYSIREQNETDFALSQRILTQTQEKIQDITKDAIVNNMSNLISEQVEQQVEQKVEQQVEEKSQSLYKQIDEINTYQFDTQQCQEQIQQIQNNMNNALKNEIQEILQMRKEVQTDLREIRELKQEIQNDKQTICEMRREIRKNMNYIKLKSLA